MIQTLTTLHPDVIRLLGISDRVMHSLYPPESTYLLPPGELLKPDTTLLGWVDNNRITGICALVERYDDGHYGELKRLIVDPAHQGKGVARHLIEAMLDLTVDKRLAYVRVETGISQPYAVRLFKNLGFRRRGPYSAYPNDKLSVFLEYKHRRF